MTNIQNIAVEFMKLIISGDIDNAFKNYVNNNAIHHNLFSSRGLYSLINSMKENHKEFPNKKLIIKNILSDKNLVLIHSHLILRDHETGLITFHLFKFDNEKIIEMWDCGQQIPSNLINLNGAF